MEPPSKMQLRQDHFATNSIAATQGGGGGGGGGGATTPASGTSSSSVIGAGGSSSLHTSSSIDGTVDDQTTNTINDDHLLLSPSSFSGQFTLGSSIVRGPNMVTTQSNSSMLTTAAGPSENQGPATHRSMYRLSSFKPSISASSDLIRNSANGTGTQGINSVTTPTYESIDVQNLSSHHLHQLGYYPRAAGSDYCPGSSGSSMGHHSLSAPFVDDDCVAIDDGQFHRLYPGAPLLGRNCGRYLSRGAPIGYHLSDLSSGQLGPILGRYSNRCSPTGQTHPHYSFQQQQHQQQQLQQQQQQQQHQHHHQTLHQNTQDPRNSYCYYPTYGRPVYPRGAAKEEDFDIFNAIFALISLTSYLVTFGMALVLAYFFACHELDHRMFVLTLGTVLLPAAIVNILSLKWLLADNQRQQQLQLQQQKSPELESIYEEVKRPDIGPCGWMIRILLHVFLLGPIVRYIELLRYGVKSWNVKRKYEQRKEWQTALPSLSTTLSRPQPYGNSATPGEAGILPNFEPASVVGRLKSPGQSSSQTSSLNSSASSPPTSASIDYYLLTVYEDRDCSLLSLFQALMQCSVQLILQLVSVMAHHQQQFHPSSTHLLPTTTTTTTGTHSHAHHDGHHHHIGGHGATTELTEQYRHPFTEYVQIAVIVTSLFELSWSVASYQRALRRVSYEKRNQSPVATVLQTLWQAGTVASRSIAVSLFIGQFGYWLCPVAIGHWGIMTVWIMHQGTHFFDEPGDRSGSNQLQEYLFNMIIGAIYLFVFVNVKDEPTRYKYAWFYSITGAESFLFTVLWFLRVDSSALASSSEVASPDTLTTIGDLLFRCSIAGTVLALFVMGLVWMQIYYWFAHPNGRPLLINKAARCC